MRFRWTPSLKFLLWANRIAYGLHGILFLVVLILGSRSVNETTWRLKHDQTIFGGGECCVASVGSPGCLYAPCNTMVYGNNSISVGVEPREALASLSLLGLVSSFFGLSFLFQGGVDASIFLFEDRLGIYQKMFLEDQKGKGLSSLYINWMRYIEYSISASVLLVAIALIAGISDADLLLCICIMCAACMLMGLVADWNYRVYIVAKELSESLYVKFFADICWWCAMISHVVAWIPIVIAWVIIMRRYYQWFDKENSRQPPQFVKTIIWGELFLFLLFGGVQILQMIFPKSRSLTELMYIFLSLFSKTLLGVAVAANIF